MAADQPIIVHDTLTLAALVGAHPKGMVTYSGMSWPMHGACALQSDVMLSRLQKGEPVRFRAHVVKPWRDHWATCMFCGAEMRKGPRLLGVAP